MCAARNFEATRICVVDIGQGAEQGSDDQVLAIYGIYGSTVVWPLGELRSLSEATLPALFG
jgi:hypothetical protein